MERLFKSYVIFLAIEKIQNNRTGNNHDPTHPKPPGGGFGEKKDPEYGSVNQFAGH